MLVILLNSYYFSYSRMWTFYWCIRIRVIWSGKMNVKSRNKHISFLLCCQIYCSSPVPNIEKMSNKASAVCTLLVMFNETAWVYFEKLSIIVRIVAPPVEYKSINRCCIGLVGVTVRGNGGLWWFLSYLACKHIGRDIPVWVINLYKTVVIESN